MEKAPISAGFVTLPSGQLFTVQWGTLVESTQRVVLMVPPFAEEMNKARKMMALLMEKLAGGSSTAGTACLLFDLFGTGDSEGVFEQANWQTWKDNLVELLDHINGQCPDCEINIVVLRTGALLVNDTLPLLRPEISQKMTQLHYWNPVFNASQFINQFLRLRLAADMMRSDGDKVSVKDLRQQLIDSGSLEVAGYAVTDAVLAGMENADIVVPESVAHSAVYVYEISSMGQITPGLKKKLEQVTVHTGTPIAESLSGPQFWSTQEISLCPELIELTSGHVFSSADRGGISHE